MGNVVAIAGGELSTTKKLNEYIVKLSNKENPKLLFIPTASGDHQGYIQNVHSCFETLGCVVDELCLCTETYNANEIKQKIDEADIIYVGGGDTRAMMRKWKEFGLDKMLLDAYKKGKVMSGLSAGANCWFRLGHSDSESFGKEKDWNYTFVEVDGVFSIIGVSEDLKAYRVEYINGVMQKTEIPFGQLFELV